MIDRCGFRLNVGIIITNDEGKLFWGKRAGSRNAWQFPQGGVDPYETLKETMYRELKEEVGLESGDIEILGVTKKWLHYMLPTYMQRKNQKPLCIGQKQKWFLIKLLGSDDKINFGITTSPEFVDWLWVDYWYPLKEVVFFKYGVYKRALHELEPLVRKNI